MGRFLPNPKLRFLDQCREVIRFERFSPRTVEAYVHWIRRFIVWSGKRHPKEMGAAQVSGFLGELALRQQVAAQITRAGVNAVLIAPQFARDAADSSAGRFWEPGRFQHFLDEAQKQLAQLYGDKRAEKALQRMPLVFIAYSGGYMPAAFAIHHGGATKRVKAVLLLDGLYGDVEKFTGWMTRYRSGIFVSAYTHLTADRNAALMKTLTERKIPYEIELKKPLRPGTVAFVETGVERRHRDFVTDAWAELPVRDFLRTLADKK